MLREAIETSRGLSHDLSPAVPHPSALAEVLRWPADRVRMRHGLTVQVPVSGATTPPSAAMTMFLFRAAHELLYNVATHAGAVRSISSPRTTGNGWTEREPGAFPRGRRRPRKTNRAGNDVTTLLYRG